MGGLSLLVSALWLPEISVTRPIKSFAWSTVGLRGFRSPPAPQATMLRVFAGVFSTFGVHHLGSHGRGDSLEFSPVRGSASTSKNRVESRDVAKNQPTHVRDARTPNAPAALFRVRFASVSASGAPYLCARACSKKCVFCRFFSGLVWIRFKG